MNATAPSDRARPPSNRAALDYSLTVRQARGRVSAYGQIKQTRRVQAEFRWVLHPDHVGHGYAAEAVQELIWICFENPGLRRVTAYCFADNAASWHLMARVGMRRAMCTGRDSLHRCGSWFDDVGYALLADEWRTLA